MINPTEYRSELSNIIFRLASLLNEKRVILNNDDTISIKEFNDLNSFKDYFTNLIDEVNQLLEALSLTISQEEQNALKFQLSKQISNITITIKDKYSKSNFSLQQLNSYKDYRRTQLEFKIKLLKELKRESNINYRGRKLTWLGSQRQLIELFDVLMEKGWIKKENISEDLQCLPIIETFNLVKNGDIVPINEDSFNKEWKGYTIKGAKIRLPKNYKTIFKNNINNPRTSKI